VSIFAVAFLIVAAVPITEMRVVYRVPGMDAVQVRRNLVYRTVGETRLELDVYSPSAAPSGARRPVVLLVHGGPVPAGARPKDWGVFVSYGQMLAASGFTAVTFHHRFHGPGALADAAGDVAAAVGYVRERADELGIDRDRIGLWAFSGGGPFLSAPLRERWPFVRGLVAYYASSPPFSISRARRCRRSSSRAPGRTTPG